MYLCHHFSLQCHSEIILIFAAQLKCLVIINTENTYVVKYVCGNYDTYFLRLLL